MKRPPRAPNVNTDPPMTPFKVGENQPGGEHGLVFYNNLYQVEVRMVEPKQDDMPKLAWLSVKRLDRAPARDWRHLQTIKNTFCGAEWEGVEMFPAESRLVDTANQTHLWVVEPPFRFPWGLGPRMVADDGPEHESTNVVQRPFHPEERPIDCLSAAEVMGLVREYVETHAED